MQRFGAGELAVTLNSEGEEEEAGETHAERGERLRRTALQATAQRQKAARKGERGMVRKEAGNAGVDDERAKRKRKKVGTPDEPEGDSGKTSARMAGGGSGANSGEGEKLCGETLPKMQSAEKKGKLERKKRSMSEGRRKKTQDKIKKMKERRKLYKALK